MCDGLSNQRVLSLIVHLKGLAVVQAVVSSCLHVCVFSMSSRCLCVLGFGRGFNNNKPKPKLDFRVFCFEKCRNCELGWILNLRHLIACFVCL